MERQVKLICGSVLSVILLGLLGGKAKAEGTCPEKDGDEYAPFTRYMALKYKLPSEAKLRIDHREAVNESCYQKVTFKGDSPLGTYELVAFVSPDLRFISTDLFDSRIDPEQERRDSARKMLGRLLQGEFASLGSADAPATVVVFSDFECPYCKQFSKVLMQEPLIKDGGTGSFSLPAYASIDSSMGNQGRQSRGVR
jgi:hypothetical protein